MITSGDLVALKTLGLGCTVLCMYGCLVLGEFGDFQVRVSMGEVFKIRGGFRFREYSVG